MLHPQPAFADDLLRYLKDRLASPEQQKSAICMNRDMALTTNDLLIGVITMGPGMRSLDALTVRCRRRMGCAASRCFTVEYQADIMDRLERKTTHQSAEPSAKWSTTDQSEPAAHPDRSPSGQDSAAH